MSEILLYHYYFAGIEKPLVIQATCRQEARLLVPAAIQGNPLYHGKTEQDIVNETVAEPVTGITRRIIEGKTYVWGGQSVGWLAKDTKS